MRELIVDKIQVKRIMQHLPFFLKVLVLMIYVTKIEYIFTEGKDENKKQYVNKVEIQIQLNGLQNHHLLYFKQLRTILHIYTFAVVFL